MDIINPYSCGLDVHKASITACMMTPKSKEIKTFGTTTTDLLELADWLIEHQCTIVAMESTGVYWKPVYNVLELTGLEVLVVNAQHIKTVPGRKTDVKDAEWIADLLKHGLLRGSFVPGKDQRELRELVRYRTKITQERTREANRIQKVLEGANIKLGDVASDVLGKSGRAMLNEIVAGNTDPQALAKLAQGRMKSKTKLLENALKGLVGRHQQMLLKIQLEHIDFLDKQVDQLNLEIKERMSPFEAAIEALDGIPGISRTTAEQVLCETGINMDQFPTDKHFASWAALCPGNNQSAGKRLKGKTNKGNMALKAALTQAALAASRTKGTYLSMLYHRIASRRGKNKASIAVAHSILISIYHMLKNGTSYQDLGVNHFNSIDQELNLKRTVKRLENMGYKVTIEPVNPAA